MISRHYVAFDIVFDLTFRNSLCKTYSATSRNSYDVRLYTFLSWYNTLLFIVGSKPCTFPGRGIPYSRQFRVMMRMVPHIGGKFGHSADLNSAVFYAHLPGHTAGLF